MHCCENIVAGTFKINYKYIQCQAKLYFIFQLLKIQTYGPQPMQPAIAQYLNSIISLAISFFLNFHYPFLLFPMHVF